LLVPLIACLLALLLRSLLMLRSSVSVMIQYSALFLRVRLLRACPVPRFIFCHTCVFVPFIFVRVSRASSSTYSSIPGLKNNISHSSIFVKIFVYSFNRRLFFYACTEKYYFSFIYLCQSIRLFTCTKIYYANATTILLCATTPCTLLAKSRSMLCTALYMGASSMCLDCKSFLQSPYRMKSRAGAQHV